MPAGTAVTLIVRAATAAEAGSAAAQAAPSGRAAVPSFDGKTVNAYLRAVALAGLVPKVVRTISPEPLGTILSVDPRPGLELAAGDQVRVNVAAGVPSLTFDTGKVVRIFDLRNGRSAREATPPQGRAVEPSWSPDGRRVLYRVGRRLLLVSARLADRGRVVYEGKTRYAAATFAPAPAEDVVALVRRNGGDGDLCFGAIGQSTSCARAASPTRSGTSGARSPGARAGASCSSSACGAASRARSGCCATAARSRSRRTRPTGAARWRPTPR